MTVTTRHYKPGDFELISDFLITFFNPVRTHGNWLQPAWEYMHSHPSLDEQNLGRIGIWEDGGIIVGVTHFELSLGEAYFQVHPEYSFLKVEMLRYAEQNLLAQADSGVNYLRAFINDFDTEFEQLARSRGYEPLESYNRPLSQFSIKDPFPSIDLAEGFSIMSLDDENDLYKINRVLWRGFDHPGEPPEDEIPGRAKMQSGPNFRKDLTIVAVEPGGNFVSFCGMWYEPHNRIAYVEPVATDPDYRRMGLG